MISSFFQWPIRIVPEKILWCTIIFSSIFYSLAILWTHRSLSITTTRGYTTKIYDERPNILYAPASLDDIRWRNANRILHQRSVSNDFNIFTIKRCSLVDNKEHTRLHLSKKVETSTWEIQETLVHSCQQKSNKRKIRTTSHVFELIRIAINWQHQIWLRFRRRFPQHMCDSQGNPFQTWFSS